MTSRKFFKTLTKTIAKMMDSLIPPQATPPQLAHARVRRRKTSRTRK